MKLPPVHEVNLDNGFKALLVERKNLPVVGTMLWYQVGARDERSGETGLSHFLEHMMFKGTDRYAKGQIDLITSKLGGSNNAFTDNDVTAYHFALAADRWHQALEIEASRMCGCLLDPQEFVSEKSVVLEELAMGEDEPMRVLFHTAEALSYQVHPYHHPVIGWKEDLERLTIDGMRAYYARHYGPNRALLVAVGDLDAKEAEARIRELFTPIAPAQPREQALQEPPQKGERRAVVRYPGEVARILIAARTCRMGEPDDFVLDVMANVLGGGKTSRLYRRLVQKDRLATGVSVSNETRQDPGMLWIAVEIVEGKDPAKAEAAVRDEVRRLMDAGPTAEELKRTRTQLRSAFLFDEETVLDLALKIGRFEALSPEGYKLLDRVLPTFAKVGTKEIKRATRTYLADDKLTVVWSLPERSAKGRSRR